MILLEMFTYPFIVRAFVVGILVSVCAALLGVPLVLKRYSMIGDGLSHVSFGALSVAVACGWAPLPVSIPVVIVAALLLLRMTELSRMGADAAIAVTSDSALAGLPRLLDSQWGFTAAMQAKSFITTRNPRRWAGGGCRARRWRSGSPRQFGESPSCAKSYREEEGGKEPDDQPDSFIQRVVLCVGIAVIWQRQAQDRALARLVGFVKGIGHLRAIQQPLPSQRDPVGQEVPAGGIGAATCRGVWSISTSLQVIEPSCRAVRS